MVLRGLNDRGQLGDGTNDDHSVPVQVKGRAEPEPSPASPRSPPACNIRVRSRPTAPRGAGASTTRANSATTPPPTPPAPVQVEGSGGTGTLTDVVQRRRPEQHSRVRSRPTAPHGAGAATTRANSATTPPPTRRSRCRSSAPAEPEHSPASPTSPPALQTHLRGHHRRHHVVLGPQRQRPTRRQHHDRPHSRRFRSIGPGGTGTLADAVTDVGAGDGAHRVRSKRTGRRGAGVATTRANSADNTTTDSFTPVPGHGVRRNRNPRRRHRPGRWPVTTTRVRRQTDGHRVVLGPQRQRPTRRQHHHRRFHPRRGRRRGAEPAPSPVSLIGLPALRHTCAGQR